MRYQVEHVTRVRYDNPIRHARFNIRLKPATWPGQAVSDFTLSIDPAPDFCETEPGPYPFHWTRIEIDAPIDALTIRTRFLAVAEDERLDMAAPERTIAQVCAAALEVSDTGRWSPANYLFDSPLLARVPAIADWAAPHLPPEAPVLSSALALAKLIQADFAYDPAATEADTGVAQSFAGRHGVCQDFAHVLIVALRSAGLPAAYVSGYLRTVPPPGQPRLVGVDAMHAWVALWCGPQTGWVGIDPTNGCIAGSGHIFAALGRDYSDVSPIDGIFVGGASQYLDTSVDVMPLEE
jgi:transglutaminase-like putative cysteine protease